MRRGPLNTNASAKSAARPGPQREGSAPPGRRRAGWRGRARRDLRSADRLVSRARMQFWDGADPALAAKAEHPRRNTRCPTQHLRVRTGALKGSLEAPPRGAGSPKHVQPCPPFIQVPAQGPASLHPDGPFQVAWRARNDKSHRQRRKPDGTAPRCCCFCNTHGWCGGAHACPLSLPSEPVLPPQQTRTGAGTLRAPFHAFSFDDCPRATDEQTEALGVTYSFKVTQLGGRGQGDGHGDTDGRRSPHVGSKPPSPSWNPSPRRLLSAPATCPA